MCFLPQVRQQSKDIAYHIRQKVRHEQVQQASAFERHQSAELQRLQARKLLLLQQHYQDSLDEVGMGHRQAALQVSLHKDLLVVLQKAPLFWDVTLYCWVNSC